ncbi:MAG: hypothetical protein ACR2QA_07640 [Solirubrobacteraceae bacterium]
MTDEPAAPNVQRLQALLELLASETPPGIDSMNAQIMRTARWQHATRWAVIAASDLAGALLAGVGLIVGIPQTRSSDPRS